MERKQVEVLRRPQVADRLKLSLRTVDALILGGQIKSFKIGKIRLVSEESLAAFIRKQETAAK